MRLKLAKSLTVLFCGLTALFGLTAPVSAGSVCDISCNGDKGCEEIKAANGCASSATVAPIQDTVTNILKVVIGISGLISAICIIIGGVNYMTSLGDAGKLKKAKDTILYATIGLVVCALAFVIVNWVIGSALGGSGSSSSGSSESSETSDEDEWVITVE